MGKRRRLYYSFFFQAEDGIRDLVRSRGLGDVYKIQVVIGAIIAIGVGKMSFGGLGNNPFNPALVGRVFPVSYTHLTLLTIYSV